MGIGIALGGLLAVLSLPAAVLAQGDQEDEYIEEIITTGTAGGAEIRKFDASFAITTMSDSDINEYAPQSTADLLKLVPGVWSESSGGVAGANVFVSGSALFDDPEGPHHAVTTFLQRAEAARRG